MKQGVFLLIAFFIVGADISVASGEGLPVDKEALVAEMESLIDATPEADPRARERVKILTQKGIKAHDAKRFDDAVKYYQQALKVDPLAHSLYYELAYTFTTMGDQVAALDAVMRALVLNPKAEDYYILEASILDDLGFRDKAKESYLALLDIQPDSYMGHLNFAITLTRTGEFELAEAEFLRAIEINPDHPSGYFNISMLFNTLGYNYDEREYLEKYLEIGKKDRRYQIALKRREELNQNEILIDPEHPYPEFELLEKLIRANWETEKHKKEFPDARGYRISFEEDMEAYTTMLSMWREKKRKEAEAAFDAYDLLLRIDDAGFLEEYIWFHRQRVFGDRATQWIESNPERMETFLAWARREDLLAEEPARPESSSALGRFRDLTTELLKTVETSDYVYEIGVKPFRPTGLLEQERDRYARELELAGKDRVACGKVSKILDEEVPKSGAKALVPVFRCFMPGEPGYEHGIRRASSLGLEVTEIEFLPVADLILGENIQLNGESSWMMYALAKAAWRHESDLRQRFGGSGDRLRASLEEEMYALAVTAGAYANAMGVEESEDPATGGADSPDPIPALDRLVEAIKANHFRGFVLYEVVHKAYRIPLDRLDGEDAGKLSDYLFAQVISRTQMSE